MLLLAQSHQTSRAWKREGSSVEGTLLETKELESRWSWSPRRSHFRQNSRRPTLSQAPSLEEEGIPWRFWCWCWCPASCGWRLVCSCCRSSGSLLKGVCNCTRPLCKLHTPLVCSSHPLNNFRIEGFRSAYRNAQRGRARRPLSQHFVARMCDMQGCLLDPLLSNEDSTSNWAPCRGGGGCSQRVGSRVGNGRYVNSRTPALHKADG